MYFSQIIDNLTLYFNDVEELTIFTGAVGTVNRFRKFLSKQKIK